MRPRRPLALGWLLLAAPLALGCEGVEEQCDTLCDFLSDCSDVELPSDCSGRCQADMDNESDSCLDALDDLVQCIDDAEGCGALDTCAPDARKLDEKC